MCKTSDENKRKVNDGKLDVQTYKEQKDLYQKRS